MGSPLGPTFANFYMSHIERSALSSLPFHIKPLCYLRYVDDTFLLVNTENQLKSFINELENISCLHFTYEMENNKREISFLDVDLRRFCGSFETKLHHKKTECPTTFDFNSYAPEVYKIAIIKTELFRIFRLCSDYKNVHVEINHLTQRLINSNFPQYLIDKTVKSFMNKYFEKSDNDTKAIDYITLFLNTSTAARIKKQKNSW